MSQSLDMALLHKVRSSIRPLRLQYCRWVSSTQSASSPFAENPAQGSEVDSATTKISPANRLSRNVMNIMARSPTPSSSPTAPTPRFNTQFQNGDFYNPNDLAYKKPGRRPPSRIISSGLFSNNPESSLHQQTAAQIRDADPFVQHDINPLHQFKDRGLMSLFVTEMGKIKPRSQTGLSAKSQRRLTKAIKRARATGFLPYTAKPYQVLKEIRK